VEMERRQRHVDSRGVTVSGLEALRQETRRAEEKMRPRREREGRDGGEKAGNSSGVFICTEAPRRKGGAIVYNTCLYLPTNKFLFTGFW
jgi:hypothetical protein